MKLLKLLTSMLLFCTMAITLNAQVISGHSIETYRIKKPNNWYFDIGSGYTLGEAGNFSLRIGYQIISIPSINLAIEGSYEGDHTIEYTVNNYCYSHHIFGNSGIGVIYFPLPKLSVSALVGYEIKESNGGTEPAIKISTAYDLSLSKHSLQTGIFYYGSSCEVMRSGFLGLSFKYRYKGNVVK